MTDETCSNSCNVSKWHILPFGERYGQDGFGQAGQGLFIAYNMKFLNLQSPVK